jgi:hypothetical protein
MTERDLFTKNLRLSKEFDLYLLEHPEIAETIPENALIVLLPEEDEDLSRQNREMAVARRAMGQPVVYVRLGKLAPSRSRLSTARVEIAA